MISYLKLLCVTTHQPSSRFLTHSHLHLQASRQTGRRIELPFLFILIVTDGEMVEEYCCILLHCVSVVLYYLAYGNRARTASGGLMITTGVNELHFGQQAKVILHTPVQHRVCQSHLL